MKGKILINDNFGRFKAGEIGVVLENTSSKYDLCLRLPGVYPIRIGESLMQAPRIFYFYKVEVLIIDDSSTGETDANN